MATKVDPKDDPKNYCPCDSSEGGLLIECGSCNQWYHVKCVALNGLHKKMVAALSNWECIRCFHPTFYRHDDLKILKAVQIAVKETIEKSDLCKKSEVESILKENTTKAVRSYSEVTAASQKKVLDEMSAVQASKSVVEEVTRKLDNDKIEREKRRLNVCVMEIPESSKTEARQRNDDDFAFCIEKLGIDKQDIDSCFRAGKKNDDTSFCRPLIIKMADQGAADYWTDDGRGWRTDHKLESGKFAYLNPDLCKADRNANFLAREERRKRIKQQQQQQQQQKPDDRKRQSSGVPI